MLLQKVLLQGWLAAATPRPPTLPDLGVSFRDKKIHSSQGKARLEGS